MMINDMDWDPESVLIKMLNDFEKYLTEDRELTKKSVDDYSRKMRRLISAYIKEQPSTRTLVKVFSEAGLLSLVKFSNLSYNAGNCSKTVQTYLSAIKCFTVYLNKERIITSEAYRSVTAEVSQGITSKAR